MTSKSLRSFAGGLIVAASLCGIVYLNEPAEANSSQPAEKVTNEEMKDMLAAKGYVIFSEKEWKNQLAENAKAEENKPKDTAKEKNNDNQKVVYRTILNVSSGMTSIDVGRSLERAKIIESARAFSNEVEKRGLSNELRPGIFEVESGMNMDQILSVIFPK